MFGTRISTSAKAKKERHKKDVTVVPFVFFALLSFRVLG